MFVRLPDSYQCQKCEKISQIDKKNAGTFGDYSFLSFNIIKNITCYTGGTLIDNHSKKINLHSSDYKILSKMAIQGQKKYLYYTTKKKSR